MAADYFTKFELQNIAVDDKLLFRHTENCHTEETSSLTREVRDDKEEKASKEMTREGSRVDPEFFLGGDVPLRNGATHW